MSSSTSTAPAGLRSRRAGPEPAAPADGSEAALVSEPWEERILGALPLFVVGAACLAVAVEFYATGAVTALGGNNSVHLRPWVLFLALGITGVAAGIVALFLEEEPEPVPAVPAAPVPAPAPPPPAMPEWDESLVEPEPSLSPRRRTWEIEWDLDTASPSAASSAAPSTALSSDILEQIEEIEASLRKKPRRPPSD